MSILGKIPKAIVEKIIQILEFDMDNSNFKGSYGFKKFLQIKAPFVLFVKCFQMFGVTSKILLSTNHQNQWLSHQSL